MCFQASCRFSKSAFMCTLSFLVFNIIYIMCQFIYQSHSVRYTLHFQGGSLQLSRDTSRHTHTDTPWSELCKNNSGSSVINSSITLSLCSASSHCCPASECACMCVTHREDFPFSGCPLPPAFGPFLSVTLTSHIQRQSNAGLFPLRR